MGAEVVQAAADLSDVFPAGLFLRPGAPVFPGLVSFLVISGPVPFVSLAFGAHTLKNLQLWNMGNWRRRRQVLLRWKSSHIKVEAQKERQKQDAGGRAWPGTYRQMSLRSYSVDLLESSGAGGAPDLLGNIYWPFLVEIPLFQKESYLVAEMLPQQVNNAHGLRSDSNVDHVLLGGVPGVKEVLHSVNLPIDQFLGGVEESVSDYCSQQSIDFLDSFGDKASKRFWAAAPVLPNSPLQYTCSYRCHCIPPCIRSLLRTEFAREPANQRGRAEANLTSAEPKKTETGFSASLSLNLGGEPDEKEHDGEDDAEDDDGPEEDFLQEAFRLGGIALLGLLLVPALLVLLVPLLFLERPLEVLAGELAGVLHHFSPNVLVVGGLAADVLLVLLGPSNLVLESTFGQPETLVGLDLLVSVAGRDLGLPGLVVLFLGPQIPLDGVLLKLLPGISVEQGADLPSLFQGGLHSLRLGSAHLQHGLAEQRGGLGHHPLLFSLLEDGLRVQLLNVVGHGPVGVLESSDDARTPLVHGDVQGSLAQGILLLQGHFDLNRVLNQPQDKIHNLQAVGLGREVERVDVKGRIYGLLCLDVGHRLEGRDLLEDDPKRRLGRIGRYLEESGLSSGPPPLFLPNWVWSGRVCGSLLKDLVGCTTPKSTSKVLGATWPTRSPETPSLRESEAFCTWSRFSGGSASLTNSSSSLSSPPGPPASLMPGTIDFSRAELGTPWGSLSLRAMSPDKEATPPGSPAWLESSRIWSRWSGPGDWLGLCSICKSSEVSSPCFSSLLDSEAEPSVPSELTSPEPSSSSSA
ncbi:hypothetical protein HWI79_3269 [Cryptosporidium felis]|nr:hypothetical protein HWI79_3269 [Cryptosporidium felis]